MKASPVIALVGAGRIALHLGKRLKSKGLPISQVINRSADKGESLAALLGARFDSSFGDLLPETEWILLAVRDDAIEKIAGQLKGHREALITHTSGATPGSVLHPAFERYGVFYPLQTFSVEHAPVWSKIPFCVDASNHDDLLFLKKTAKIIGNLVYQVNDTQRAQLHIAAVFANNFVNHCFTLAEKILESTDLPFEMIHPLMEETLAKALHDSPEIMQTGPAARGDVDTIQRHLNLLEHHPNWRLLYENLTKSINQQLPI